MPELKRGKWCVKCDQLKLGLDQGFFFCIGCQLQIGINECDISEDDLHDKIMEYTEQ